MGMSLIALASGQLEPALTMAGAAVMEAPQRSVSWVTLGQALKASCRLSESEASFRQALRLNPEDGLARIGLGELCMALNSPEEALEHFEQALRRQPALSAAHLGAGHALACAGRDEEAHDRYSKALSLDPQSADAAFAMAFVLARMSQPQEAEAHYRHALSLRPNFAAAWMNLGCLLREQGRMLHAEAALARAAQLQPEAPEAWLNLALIEKDRGRTSEAERRLLQALRLQPERVETLVAWCQLRLALKDFAGARAWLRWAAARGPSHPEVVNMEGILLHSERRFAEAARCFQRAERLGSKAAASNLGNSLLDLGRMQQALAAHKRAVDLDPKSAGAAYNLALTRLRLGDWRRGWAGYEARWRFREVHPTPLHFRCPRWKGEPIEGKRLLLYAEQGLGDAIQFCRYVPLAVARGAKVILQVHAPLERLMRSLAPVRAGLVELARLGEEPPPFDLECPLMSLPAVFGTTVETVPWTGAYLGPESTQNEHGADVVLPQTHRGLRVGVNWAGNPRYKADAQRSMRLQTLLPLLRLPGVQWVSLQKGEPAKELEHLPAAVRVCDASSGDCDLADTAARIASLDLVITTDTSIAHLAGAMGWPVWILLPHLSDWRWMQDIDTTPWYPAARLFRQDAPGDWEAVVRQVSAALIRSFF